MLSVLDSVAVELSLDVVDELFEGIVVVSDGVCMLPLLFELVAPELSLVEDDEVVLCAHATPKTAARAAEAAVTTSFFWKLRIGFSVGERGDGASEARIPLPARGVPPM